MILYDYIRDDARAHEKQRHFSRRSRPLLCKLLIKRWLYPPPQYGKSFSDNTICDEGRHMNAITKSKNKVFVREYQVSGSTHSAILTRGSPNAVEISAMDFNVRLGKPDVHLEITASDRPILFARSRWVMFFCLRTASMRAMISADSCTSDMISGDTAAIFSLNHSCLFLIANVMFSIPDRFFFFSDSKDSENRVNAQVN